MKLSKQERKRILAELNEIQNTLNKQASSGFFKPDPIEYTDEADLNVGIDSVLLDILDGFGYMGATNIVVKGNTAYVKGEFELELDVKQKMLGDLLPISELEAQLSKFNWEEKSDNLYYGEYAQVAITISLTPKGFVLKCFAANPAQVVKEKMVTINEKQLEALKITKVIDIGENPMPTILQMEKEFRNNFRKYAPWFLNLKAYGGEQKILNDILNKVPHGKHNLERDVTKSGGDWEVTYSFDGSRYTFRLIFRYLSDPTDVFLEAKYPEYEDLVRNAEFTGDYDEDITYVSEMIYYEYLMQYL